MKYQTYVAAAIIGLCSAGAAADDQNPSANPEGTHTTGQASSAPEAQLNQDMSTGEKQSDARAAGQSTEDKTGEASSAGSINASSHPDQSASQQNGDEQSAYDQANSDDQANAEDSAADQQAVASDEEQSKLIVVVPEEMQDQMEDLIAFIQSTPNAQIVVVSQDDQDDSEENQEQDNTFMFPESEAE